MVGKGGWLWVGRGGGLRVEKEEGKGWVMGGKRGMVKDGLWV